MRAHTLLTPSCAAGHATNRHSVKDNIDSLAGIKAEKIIKRLAQFGNGERESTVMHHFSVGYTEAEVVKMVNYFEEQE